MHGPVLVGWLLVTLCGAAGGLWLARARTTAGHQRRTAAAEALMGLGMAAMALPAPLLPPVAAFVLPFAGAAVWSARAAWTARRTGPPPLRRRAVATHGRHTTEALAMVYMALTMGGEHRHGIPGGVPLLTGALLTYFALTAVHAARRLPPACPDGRAPAGTDFERGLPAAGRLVLAVAMLTMLLTL